MYSNACVVNPSVGPVRIIASVSAAPYLEHVCIAVVGVLHHHHLDPGQSVRDAVLVFVAYGLKEQDEGREKKGWMNRDTGERTNHCKRNNLHDICANTMLELS